MPIPPRPDSGRFRFVLPPSVGASAARERGALLERVLTGVLNKAVEVSVAQSYEALAVDLLAGRADAAWCPPFTCARVEAMGVRVLVRAVRHGNSTYRAAIVCRSDVPLAVNQLKGKRAVWVDRDAVAGYLLPRAHLKAQALDPAKMLLSETFAGSYQAALETVLEERADFTAVFAPTEGNPREGLEEVLPGRADRYHVIALTEPSPNDGVVVGIALAAAASGALENGLLGLVESADGRTLLKDIFHADRFEQAPRLSYRALYRVALASL
jgi:phosphonate transport system substrate-binding protein